MHSFQRVKAYTTLLSLETLSLRNLWRDIKCGPEASGEKCNVLQWILGRNFQSNSFVMCAFHAGSYTSFLIRHCLNTVPVNLKKWYFAVHWRLRRKVKYPKIKPRKKGFKKLLSDVCIHFTEWKRTLRCPVWKLCLWGIWRDIKWCPETCGDKGNVLRWQLERSFQSNCFVIWVLIS